MTDQIVRLGPEYFSDPTVGRPVAAGSIYIGDPDTDPEILANQITVNALQEDGTTVPISQPILTSAGGQPLYNGSPVTLLVSETYSLKVLDSFGVQKNYVPSTNVPIDIAISGILQLDDLQALLAISSPSNDDTYVMLSFFDSEGNGGGTFYWDASQDKADANGATIIDPDNIGGYDGTVSTLPSYFTDQSAGVGVGCWMRMCDRTALVTWFGAIDDATVNNAVALQAAFDFLKSSYSNGVDAFVTILDFGGRVYRTESSLDFTMLRQPGATIQNGGVHGACAGKTVLDFAGTNTMTLKDFIIYGDKDDTPQLGYYVGRATDLLHSAGHRFINVFVNGYFTKSCAVNLASEVFQSTSCRYRNMSRKLTSYAFVNTGHAGTLDTYIGTLTSEFVTLPIAADGEMSNILHYHHQGHFQRASDMAIPMDSITKANPAVVSVDPTALTNSELANGDKVYFNNIVGMTELNHASYTVTNINTGAGTFSLQGIDSTTYGTFVSGTVFNQTGPAVLLGGAHSMFCEASYFLAQGSSSIIVDLETGLPIRDCRLSFHAEPHPFNVIDFRRTTVAEVDVYGLEVKLLNTSQVISKDVFRITGGGTINLLNLILNVSSLSTAPQNKFLFPASGFRLNNAHITSPIAAALNPTEDFIGFSGSVASADDNTLTTTAKEVGFQSTGVSLDKPGLRYALDSIYAYRSEVPAERRVHVQDTAITTGFTAASDRINVYDKYTGKPAFNVSTNQPLWATGGGTTDTWVDATGSTVYTPS